MNAGIDLSCLKKIQIGKPQSADCPKGKEYNAGLCYPPCKSGYFGVGPVCWAHTPSGWVGCGMGAAKDSKICAAIKFDQVASVGQMAVNIATLGSSSPSNTALNAARKAGKIAELKEKF